MYMCLHITITWQILPDRYLHLNGSEHMIITEVVLAFWCAVCKLHQPFVSSGHVNVFELLMSAFTAFTAFTVVLTFTSFFFKYNENNRPLNIHLYIVFVLIVITFISCSSTDFYIICVEFFLRAVFPTVTTIRGCSTEKLV